MDLNIIRSPLKEINRENTNNSEFNNDHLKLKRKKKPTSENQEMTQKLVKGQNLSSKDESTEEIKKAESQRSSGNYNEAALYTVLKVNKLFMEDLKYPQFSPLSLMKYSCSSAISCKYENHKIASMQISETEEKSLTFLSKSWYVLKYPLTCLLNQKTHLSPFVLRFLFYGIVDEKDESICFKLRDIIKGHLKLHPPCNEKLKDLYYNALVGDIDNVDLSNPDIVTYNFKNIFLWIENVITELNMKPQDLKKYDISNEINSSFEIPSNVDEVYKFFSDNYIKTGQILPSALISPTKYNDQEDKMKPVDKLKRLFIVFTLMVDILEENLRMWWIRSRYCLQKKLYSKQYFPIIAKIVWDQRDERGSLNEHCCKVFEIFKSCPEEYRVELARYLSLIGEVVRASEDNNEKKFPFIGERCNSFAETLSDYVKDGNIINEKTISLVQYIYPSWLKFKVCGYILKSELTSGGVDNLDSILKILQRNLSPRPKPLVLQAEKTARQSKHLNVKHNKTDSSGETVMHKFCRTNNYKSLASILRNKDANVNIADNAGWTPLHNAAKYNSIECLKLLIKRRIDTTNGAEELDIFSLNDDNDSALSCALKEGNDEVVKILLKQRVGVTVWNIMSSGLSSVDHAKTEEMKEVLENSWKQSISSYKYINMTPSEIDLVYSMLSSYCKVYHTGEHCNELDSGSCKPDSHYNFDYSHFCLDEIKLKDFFELVQRLSIHRSNPKNLKNILFFLKLKNIAIDSKGEKS